MPTAQLMVGMRLSLESPDTEPGDVDIRLQNDFPARVRPQVSNREVSGGRPTDRLLRHFRIELRRNPLARGTL